MSTKLPTVPDPQDHSSIWKRLGIYFLFAVSVTILLYFLTPGFFVDEAFADAILVVIVTIIEIRKKIKTNKK